MEKKNNKNQASAALPPLSGYTDSDKKSKPEDWLANLAHELKNPLNFIKNFGQLLEDDAQSLEEALAQHSVTPQMRQLFQNLRNNLAKIILHTNRADEIITDMLAQAQGEGNEFQSTDLHRLLDESIALAQESIRTQYSDFGINIITNYDHSINFIQADSRSLGRAFLNMINNAVYALWQKTHTHVGKSYVPTLSIATTNLTDLVRICIRDNGAGMSAEILHRVFEPLFSAKTSHHGSGLGLSISHDIIRKHTGKITVNSEPDQFTEFIISLPNPVEPEPKRQND